MPNLFLVLITDHYFTIKIKIHKLILYPIVIGGRVPKMDDDTMEILSEEALVVYLNYLD